MSKYHCNAAKAVSDAKQASAPTAAGATKGRGGEPAHGDNTSRHTLFGAEWSPSTIHFGHTNQHHNTHQFGQYAAELCSPMRAWVGAPWTTYRAGGGTSIATVGQRQTGSMRTHLPTLRRMWGKEGGMTFVYSHHDMLFIASFIVYENVPNPHLPIHSLCVENPTSGGTACLDKRHAGTTRIDAAD